MSLHREQNGPAPLEALFRGESSRLDFGEDEDDHSAFVMSLSRLANNLATYSETPASPLGVVSQMGVGVRTPAQS
jgi:hypothetical protein